MTKDMFSDGVLVYDRYYCSKLNTPLLVIKRILLTVAFCVCSMLFILTEFGFPVSLPAMAAICAASCGGFSVLLVFVKKRYAVPAVLAVSGIAVWQWFEPLIDRLSYFADACMLLVEGRFLYPRRYLFHRGEVLDSSNPGFVEGVFLGTALLCAAYSLVIAICFSKRIHAAPAILLFAALCVPVLISERLEFSVWIIPALAAFAGLYSIKKCYSAGLAARHVSSGEYRRRVRQEEKSFIRNTASARFPKQLEMRCNYYSKYFSVGMYCAALTAVCLIVGAAIIPEGGSIDYTGVYDFIVSFKNEGVGQLSPFEDGIASDYFAHGGAQRQDQLNIISPGRGEREIIRVSYTGDRPIYLRGDIGIDFNGTSWTTAVGDEPPRWSSSGLKDSYRPCESRVIAALLSASVSGGAETQIITASDVTIEYLCGTNVVFLPPYTAEYSFYNNESFDVYADYAVRVSDRAGSHVNSVQCTALLPSYMSNETHHGDPNDFAVVENVFDESLCTVNDIYSSVVPEMTEENILADYESYVYDTYLSIPDEFATDITEYIQRTLSAQLDPLRKRYESGELSEAQYRYQSASLVADYLRSNYSYSLDGSNSGRNPVMQFLNDTKRGHCSLYASAMTLILRDLGIPARYCTGFYVEGENGSHSVLLREKNLHAWVEVYTGQFGWVTFDPTSSSAYPGRNASAPVESTGDISDQHTAEISFTSDIRPPVMHDVTEYADPAHTGAETAETDVPQESSAFTDTLRLIAPAALVLTAVLTAGIILLTKLHRLKRSARSRLDSLKAGGSTDCAREAYQLILALLAHYEIAPVGGELPMDFWQRADARFGTGLAGNAETLEAMEFGGHEVSDEERAAVLRELEQIIAKIRPFNFPGNIRVLKIICGGAKFSGKI